MSYLVLVRHGLSEYNAKGIWAGWDDPELTLEGVQEAKKAGAELKDIVFDVAFTADLKRTQKTLETIKEALGIQEIPTVVSPAIKERNYGDFTRKNKWEIKDQLGDEEFTKLRRSWNYPVPNGESLKQVYERAVPYYQNTILPYLQSEKNVLIVSSGNSLRALVKYLEHIPDEDIANLEIGTGEILIYTLDKTGTIVNKEKRATNPNKV